MRPRYRDIVIAAAVSVAAPLFCKPAAAQSQADDNLSQFENLLADPNGVSANSNYAASLQTSGEATEARQVYQKVLSLDPNNVVAKAALAAPIASPTIAAATVALPPAAAAASQSGAQTNYILRFGSAYESNSARLPMGFGFNGYPDAVGFAEFTVNDTRQIGGITLQSNLDVYSNFHARYTPGDISYVNLDSGPIVQLGAAGKLRVAVGGEYVLEGQSPLPAGERIRQFEFDAGNMIFNWFPAQAQALQSVNLLVGYDNFRDSDRYRSGVVMHLTTPLVFNDVVAATHTQLIVTPGFVYNGADQPSLVPPLQPAHYAEGDLDVLTLTPLAEQKLGAARILGKVGIFADKQYYDSHDPIPTNDRQDIRMIPTAGVQFAGFLWPNVQLDLDYRYDRNFSNDAAQRFADHIVSLIATIRF